MPPPSSPTPTPKPSTKTSKFDESKWYKKWHGFDAKMEDTHQSMREIFNADDEYWKALEQRVRKAHPAKIDEKTLNKFPRAVRARSKYFKEPWKFFEGYKDFEESYADAVFLKDLIGKLRSLDPTPAKGTVMPQLDKSPKSGTTKAESSLKTKGTVTPKLDKSTRPSASASTTVSRAQGTLMPKLDKTRAPESSSIGKGTVMPKLDKTRTPESSTKPKGTLMPQLDNTRKPTPSSSSTKIGTRLAPLDRPSPSSNNQLAPPSSTNEIRSADGTHLRQETHERKWVPMQTGPNGAMGWGWQESVRVREMRVVRQAFRGRRDESGEVVWTPVAPGSEGMPQMQLPAGWEMPGGSVREIGKDGEREKGSGSGSGSKR